MDLKFSFIVDVYFVLFWVGVNVGQDNVLTSNSSELNSSKGCTFGEDVAGHWESCNQFSELFLFYAMTVGCAVKTTLVEFRGAEPKQDLVVAKIVRCMKGEVLIFILLVQTEGNFPLKNHVELWEGLSFLYNSLVCDEHTAVQLAGEE